MERKQEEKNGRKRGKAFKNVEREAPACIAPSSASRSRRGSEERRPGGGSTCGRARRRAPLRGSPSGRRVRTAREGVPRAGFEAAKKGVPHAGFEATKRQKKKGVNLNRTDTIFEKDDRQITRAENLPVCPELYRSLWLVIGP